MFICFQRQTTFPSGVTRRGVQVPTESRHSYLQLTLGYSQSLLPVICTSVKPGQAQPTGNYQVKLPRTASLICPSCCRRGGDRGASSSVPPHGDLSPAFDPFCQPGATRTKGVGTSRCCAQHPSKASGSRRGSGAASEYPPSQDTGAFALSCAIPISRCPCLLGIP